MWEGIGLVGGGEETNQFAAMIGFPNGFTRLLLGFILTFEILERFFFFCNSRPMIAFVLIQASTPLLLLRNIIFSLENFCLSHIMVCAQCDKQLVLHPHLILYTCRLQGAARSGYLRHLSVEFTGDLISSVGVSIPVPGSFLIDVTLFAPAPPSFSSSPACAYCCACCVQIN